MWDLLRKDLQAARRFYRTFRYIDDLLTLYNSSFKNSIDTIYPLELELKRAEGPTTCSYFVSIAGHRFCTDLYNKRDAFNFRIVNFPHIRTVISSKPAYGAFISQLVGYVVITNNSRAGLLLYPPTFENFYIGTLLHCESIPSEPQKYYFSVPLSIFSSLGRYI